MCSRAACAGVLLPLLPAGLSLMASFPLWVASPTLPHMDQAWPFQGSVLYSAVSCLGCCDWVLAISEARLADLALCWSAWELRVMNGVFSWSYLIFPFPTFCFLGTVPHTLRFKWLWWYVCRNIYMLVEEEQQLKIGGSGWRCNDWHHCLCTSNRDEPGGLCSRRYLGWSTESHCWEHGSISWVRGRTVCTGKLLAVYLLYYQGYIWHQN